MKYLALHVDQAHFHRHVVTYGLERLLQWGHGQRKPTKHRQM
jgi:hypothetical protein